MNNIFLNHIAHEDAWKAMQTTTSPVCTVRRCRPPASMSSWSRAWRCWNSKCSPRSLPGRLPPPRGSKQKRRRPFIQNPAQCCLEVKEFTTYFSNGYINRRRALLRSAGRTSTEHRVREEFILILAPPSSHSEFLSKGPAESRLGAACPSAIFC